jgi:hypothetical protein
LNERRNESLQRGIVFVAPHKHADAPHALVSLRMGRNRPSRRRAAEKRDELAPLQLIELHSVPARAALHDIELARISQRVGRPKWSEVQSGSSAPNFQCPWLVRLPSNTLHECGHSAWQPSASNRREQVQQTAGGDRPWMSLVRCRKGACPVRTRSVARRVAGSATHSTPPPLARAGLAATRETSSRAL